MYQLLFALALIASFTMASETATKPVPKEAWDCHFHIFAPQSEYQFSPSRAYTPSTANITQLAKFETSLGIKNLCLVHGYSYSNDDSSLLHYLSELNGNNAGELNDIGTRFHARGVCSFDVTEVTDELLDSYHEAGVRSVRINFGDQRAADDVERQVLLIQDTAKRLVDWWERTPLRASTDGKCKWSVQVSQEHVEFWPQLREVAKTLPLRVVVDHMAYVQTASSVPNATVSGVDTEGFSDLIGAIKDGNTWVKLSGPYRCSREEPGYPDLEDVVKELVKADSSRVIWGSDWPHIMRSSDRAKDGRKWDVPEPFLEIDIPAWIESLSRWLNDEEWSAMWVENPEILYDSDE